MVMVLSLLIGLFFKIGVIKLNSLACALGQERSKTVVRSKKAKNAVCHPRAQLKPLIFHKQ